MSVGCLSCAWWNLRCLPLSLDCFSWSSTSGHGLSHVSAHFKGTLSVQSLLIQLNSISVNVHYERRDGGKEIFIICVFQTALVRFPAGCVHVATLHVGGWDKFGLCFDISWASSFQGTFECAVCLCDLYIKADSRIILTKQRKDLDWKVLST